MGKSNLAVITARSGSKGLRDKNIKLLDGKPLMWYTVNSAKESDMFTHVMVSTDSERYAQIAKECGAEVPFLRSAENSTDNASSWDVVREVISKYRDLGITFETVCLLQPTSPLRLSKDISDAYQLFAKKKATTVIGVCETDHPPLWENTLSKSLSMDNFICTDKNARQQIDTYYRINGAIYIVQVEHLLNNNNIYYNSFAYIMPKERSIDIDSKFDFVIAEAIMKYHF